MYPNVMECLPVAEKETLKFPRQYLANVVYTIVGEPFKVWVTSQANKRHAKMAEKNNVYIKLDPEIAAAFRAS